MFPTDVVIVAGARTPMSRYTGAFSDVSAIDLAVAASKEAIRRSNADPAEFDHAIFGNVMQTSADALYGASPVCHSRIAQRSQTRRRRTGRFAHGGINGHVLWAADGADRRKARRPVPDHPQRCRRLRFAQPASRGRRIQSMPHER